MERTRWTAPLLLEKQTDSNKLKPFCCNAFGVLNYQVAQGHDDFAVIIYNPTNLVSFLSLVSIYVSSSCPVREIFCVFPSLLPLIWSTGVQIKILISVKLAEIVQPKGNIASGHSLNHCVKP